MIVQIYKLGKATDYQAEDVYNFEIENIDHEKLISVSKLLDSQFRNFPIITKFPEPFKEKFASPFSYLNINHPLVVQIVKICLLIVKYKEGKEFPSEVTGKLYDMANSLPFINKYHYSKITISELNAKISTLIDEVKIINLNINIQPPLTIDDFVRHSIITNDEVQGFDVDHDMIRYTKNAIPWGVEYNV